MNGLRPQLINNEGLSYAPAKQSIKRKRKQPQAEKLAAVFVYASVLFDYLVAYGANL